MDAITPGLLELLGFRPADAADLLARLPRLTPGDHAEIERLTGLLRGNLGRVGERVNPVGEEPRPHRLGTDFPLLIALVSVAPEMVAVLTGRGVDEETAWRSASDLGQQVHIHRLVHGGFGLGAGGWVAMNYSGSLLWLGRLQYTLEPDTASLGCHIPEAGPLTPELVDASLELARQVALPAYSDFEITGFTCTSWLLDAGLSERLPATSNVARFAARFEPYGEPGDGRRDALFFGFHKETGGGAEVDLDTLPQDSSLQRAALAGLRGDGVTVTSGRMPLR